VFEIKGSRFVDLKENGDNIKRGWITQNQCFPIKLKITILELSKPLLETPPLKSLLNL
jgi:hypothetical protein